MNYLAHAYLSFNHPQILVGNIISDFVKGKKKFHYLPLIQKGIALHRAIDEFTDAHPATKQAKAFFRPRYRLYSAAFVDVVYDHFLANDKNEFSLPEQLQIFSTGVYKILDEYFSFLPEHFQKMFPHMQQHNWLYNYRHPAGIEKSFGGLARRALYLNDSSFAYTIFLDNYNSLHKIYCGFFSEVKHFATTHLNILEN